MATLRSLFTPRWQQADVEQDLSQLQKTDPKAYLIATAVRPTPTVGEAPESFSARLRHWEATHKKEK